MPIVVTGKDEIFGPWFCKVQGTEFVPGASVYIGLMEGEEILAVAAYDNFNQANVNMHIAAIPGKRWLIREYLWYCFYYPFITLKVRRVTGIVPSGNLQARKFDENLGFTLEATLKDAHPDGDLLVYVMTKESCRWLTLKERSNGKTIGTSSS